MAVGLNSLVSGVNLMNENLKMKCLIAKAKICRREVISLLQKITDKGGDRNVC